MSAPVDRRLAPRVSGIGEISLPAPDVTLLPNGAELRVLDRGDVPVCRITACWRAGRADVASPSALALAAGAMRCGTSSRSEAEIAETLEYNGAWLNCRADHHASFLNLYSLNKALDKVLPVVADMLTDAAYTPAVVAAERDKEAARLEVQNRRLPRRAEALYAPLAYGEGAPMARFTTAADVARVEAGDVRGAYEALFRGQVPVFYLAGRVDDDTRRRVAEALGSVPYAARQAQLPAIVPAPERSTGAEVTAQVDGSLQTAIKTGIRVIPREHPDYEKLRFAVMLLGGYFGSRLMTNIREDKGYTYGINASLTGQPEGSFVTIACETDNVHARAVLAEVEREIYRLATEDVPAEEMDIVRNLMLSSLAGVTDTPFAMADYHIYTHAMGLPAGQFERQSRAARETDAADVRRLAARLLAGTPRLTALAGDITKL